MPDFTMADLLAAQAGAPGPVYEGGPTGNVRPGDVLGALSSMTGIGQGPPTDTLTNMARLYRSQVEDPIKNIMDESAYYAQTGDPTRAGPEGFKTVLGLAGVGMPFAEKGAAGVFGGRIGAERLAAAGKPEALNNLPKAEAMHAAGAAPEEIHAATGWAPDAAGKLSFEIPDYGTGFRPMAPLPEGTGVEGQLSPFIGGPIGKPGREMLAEHAYNHPDLFTAYPELARYAMKFEDPVKREGFLFKGGADPVNKDFYLNPEAFSGPGGREAMRSTMLHEFQHPVQAIENFPSGGSPNMPEVRQAADAAIAARKQAAQTQIDNIFAQRDAYVREQEMAGRDGDAGGFVQEFWKNNPDLRDKTTQAYINIDRAIGRRNSEIVKQYKSVAGEVQARNVQARADIPPEQLKDLPPSYTQDTPNSQQLLRFSDPATGYHMDEPSFTERMAALKDAAFQRAQKGTATGDYGLGTARRTAPEAPAGSMESASDRLMSSLRDTQRQLQEYKNPPAKPLLAPGERPQDLQFSTELNPRMADVLEGQGDVAGPVTGVGRPYISEANRPLFDYSRLSDVPNVPQFNLPRVNPPEGVPESATSLAAPKNIARVNKAVGAGEALGGREWYNTEPLREQFVSELGDAAGNAAFRQYMGAVASTSPRTKVPENIRNASYYYGLLQRGEDLPRTYLEGGYHRMVKSTQAPSPYGAMPIHIQNLENVRTGSLPVLQNPKPASFVENLTGNQTPVTIDTHNMRLLTGSREAEVPKANEYGFLENLQQEQAAKMGMSPAQYQASAWLGAGKETGLASPVEPFLRTLESRIEKTAEATGRTKAEVLRQFIRGQAPLLSLGAVAAGAAQGLPSQEPTQ